MTEYQHAKKHRLTDPTCHTAEGGTAGQALLVGPDGKTLIWGSPGEDWRNMTLLNSFANYGGGWGVAQYKKVGDLVFLRGFLRRNPILADTDVFVLPVGYRPPAMYMYGQIFAGGLMRVDIYSGGNVHIAAAQVGTISGDQWISLSGIAFSTA